MIDYCELAVPGVRSLTPYQPGKPIEDLQRELGLHEIIKLASNENPFGPSPIALEKIKTSLSDLARYPDGNGFELKTKLANFHGVELNQITLGNGSNDLLEFVARTFVNPGEEVIFSRHAFAVYPLVTQAIGGVACEVPATDWGNDLEAMLSRVTDKTRLIFIANPNNPTGTWINESTLKTFLNRLPENIIVVLDEAYFEYAAHEAMQLPGYPDGLKLLEQFPSLIVTRTFSKAYGLAGLRVGYGVSSAIIADLLNRVRQPFNVNSLALSAATAALDDREHIDHSVQQNVLGMAQLIASFDEHAIQYIPSAGNFISFDVGKDAGDIYQALLQQGVIVRPIANYAMPTYLRVTIGSRQENEFFIKALNSVLRSS